MKIRELTNRFFDIEGQKFDRKVFSCKDDKIEEQKLNDRINMRCLKNAVSRFLSSGQKDDAFDVYFCFSEIYTLFGRGYAGNTQKLLNILGDHEAKAGGIKDTFRDHYSHMVYVFSLGLAVYYLNENYRKAFEKQCVYSETMTTDEEFLYRWGMTALFHDIGYPFEIAFNNIKEYTQDVFSTTKIEQDELVTAKGPIEPLLTYTKIDKFTTFTDEEKKRLRGLNIAAKYKASVHTLLAYRASQLLGIDYEILLDSLNQLIPKSTRFIDHAYFSAIVMFKKLITNAKDSASELQIYIDACVAILLHSGLWRNQFALKRAEDGTLEVVKKVGLEAPLMFLLILCDELHIFDRIGYGRKSKDEPLPFSCYLEPIENGLEVAYAFSERSLVYKGKVKECPKTGNVICQYREGEYIEKKIYNRQNGDEGVFYKLAILELKDFGVITFAPEISKNNAQQVYHTSISFYQNLLDLAIAIHKNYNQSDTYNKLMIKWDEMNLEQKMWNILPAKSYAEKLDKLGYFYDDKELLLERVYELTPEQIEVLARSEHKRWENVMREMGWQYGDYDASNSAVKSDMRSVFKRLHNCLVPFDDLDENDRNKDREVVKNIIPNLTSRGFYVYNPARTKAQKKVFSIGITGHGDLSRVDEGEIKKQLTQVLSKHVANKNHDIIVINNCDKGFDTIAAIVCMELGVKIKIVIPYGGDNPFFRDNSDMQRLAKYENKEILFLPQLTKPISGVPDKELKYIDLAKFLAANSDHMIVGWDGVETEAGKHGTFYTKQLAQKYGKGIEIIGLLR